MIPREMVTMMERRRLVAEVRTQTAIQALSVVDALAAAGVTTIEVSLTIPGAQEILTHLATRQDVLVGAGAVLNPQQATQALSCGARFIASPILAPELVPVCRDANVACILGALTPTEIIAAQHAGAEMVKLFPVEALGGAAYLRALLRQLTHVSIQVSGGFTAESMMEYLLLPVRTLALGSLLTPKTLVERGAWQALTNRARAFVEFAANPHANAARFLSMMGAGAGAGAGAGPQFAQAQQGAPAPIVDVRGVIAAVPTVSIPPNLAAAVVSAVEKQPFASQSALDDEAELDEYEEDQMAESGFFAPSKSSSSFHPWDSRPVENGDKEDWLR